MTTVIKVGGARAVDPAGALSDVATLYEEGEDVSVVHGGSTAVDETLERLGIEPEYVETPSGVVGRFTDEETMEVFEMVFGHLNTQLVSGLQSLGVNAVGLNGVDGKLLHGPRKSAVRVVEDGKKKIKRGDHSGTIQTVNTDLLWSLFAIKYVPVVSPPMAGVDDDDDADDADGGSSSSVGTDTDDSSILPVNTDADRSAAAIAGALDATLVLLTDVEGVYEDPDDPSTLIESVETAEEWDTLEDAAEGFMERKIMAAEEALKAGAPKVVIADANADEPILSALDGEGTHLFGTAVEVTE